MENKKQLFNPLFHSKIYFIRGHCVMLDSDLAQLTEIEEENLKSQIATSSLHGGRRKFSTVFTQEGIAMLSGVLHSETAVKANIEIMRTFVRIKNSESENQALWTKLDQLEKKYDASFSGVFEAIRDLRMGELPNEHQKIKPIGE